MTRLLLIALFAIPAWSAAITSAQAGAWSATATWTGGVVPGSGDTVTVTKAVTVDVNTIVGTSPVAGTAVLTVTNTPTQGSLTINSGITLTVLGDFVLVRSTLTFSATSILEFDPTASAAPTTTSYRLQYGSGATAPYASLQSSGTSAGNEFSIRTKPSAVALGYKRARVEVGTSVVTIINLAYGLMKDLGDTVNPAFNWATGTSKSINVVFDHITWDWCGLVKPAVTVATDSGWLFDYNIFKNTNAITAGTGHQQPLFLTGTAPTGTAVRIVRNSSFDKQPSLLGNGSTYQNNYFAQGWDNGSSTSAWAEFSGSVIRGITTSGITTVGGVTNSYYLHDTWATAVVGSSGTATSATSTTLTDSTKSWTLNQWLGNSSTHFYFVQITGGTGVGQSRGIVSNTATPQTLLVNWAWTITPDATSTYTIWDEIPNPHMLGLSGYAATYSGNVFEWNGGSPAGDCLLESSMLVAVTVANNIALPNGTGNNTCTGINFGSVTDNLLLATVTHNTWFGGAQSPAVSDYPTRTGLIASFKSNLIWMQNSGPTGSLGPFKLVDEGNAAGGGTVFDIVAPANANYNACWNCLAGSYQGNGYSLPLTTQAGANDVNLSGGSGPDFVDSTRNFARWAATQGSTGTLPQDFIADGLTKLANLTYSPVALVAWVKAGFAPRASSLHNTAHDGTDIGAVAWQAAAGSSGTAGSVISGGVGVSGTANSVSSGVRIGIGQ